MAAAVGSSANFDNNLDWEELEEEEDFVIVEFDGEEAGSNRCYQPGNSQEIEYEARSNEEDFEMLTATLTRAERMEPRRIETCDQAIQTPPDDRQSKLDDLVITLKVKLSSMAPEPKRRLIKFVEKRTQDLGRNFQEKIENVIRMISNGSF